MRKRLALVILLIAFFAVMIPLVPWSTIFPNGVGRDASLAALALAFGIALVAVLLYWLRGVIGVLIKTFVFVVGGFTIVVVVVSFATNMTVMEWVQTNIVEPVLGSGTEEAQKVIVEVVQATTPPTEAPPEAPEVPVEVQPAEESGGMLGTVQAGRTPSVLPEPWWVDGVSPSRSLRDLAEDDKFVATHKARTEWVLGHDEQGNQGFVWSPWFDWDGDITSLPQMEEVPPPPQ